METGLGEAALREPVRLPSWLAPAPLCLSLWTLCPVSMPTCSSQSGQIPTLVNIPFLSPSWLPLFSVPPPPTPLAQIPLGIVCLLH